MSNINPLALNPMALPSGYTPYTPGATAPSTTSSTSGSAANTNPLSSLADNSQAFLQLLVAQLKYQDPMSPVSGTAFLSQTAQMMQASQTTQMVQMVQQEATATETSTASSLIGRSVTGIDTTNNKVTGVVTSVSIDPTNGPTLNLQGGQTVALESVTEVSQAS